MGEKIVSVQNLQVFFPVEGSLFGALRKEEKKFVSLSMTALKLFSLNIMRLISLKVA